jgi:hypothetical protein
MPEYKTSSLRCGTTRSIYRADPSSGDLDFVKYDGIGYSNDMSIGYGEDMSCNLDATALRDWVGDTTRGVVATMARLERMELPRPRPTTEQSVLRDQLVGDLITIVLPTPADPSVAL